MRVFVIVLPLAIASCTSRFGTVVDAKSNSVQTEQQALKIVALEGVVTNVVRASGSIIVFVNLSDADMSKLSKRQPDYCFKSASRAEYIKGLGFRDKWTDQVGVQLSVDSVDSKANRAAAYVEWIGKSTKIKYGVDMAENHGWVVTNVWTAMILDLR